MNTNNTTQISHDMLFDRWNASLQSFNTLLDELSDEQLMAEIAPGKNRGIYLLGHLIAVHDNMLILLDMGAKLYPELHEPFIKAADKTIQDLPSVSVLRSYWKNQCEVLHEKCAALTPEQWYEKHSAVSEADFEKEPNRNKLNIILTRTTHLAYHTGQMQLLF